jgi:hypothetical protein
MTVFGDALNPSIKNTAEWVVKKCLKNMDRSTKSLSSSSKQIFFILKFNIFDFIEDCNSTT